MDGSVSEGVVRPLRALWRHHRRFRPRVVAAVAATTVNTAADVAPELLLGVAVDIVVRGADSFASNLFGIEDRFAQLVAIASLNVIVWVVESISDYVAAVLWRGLSQVGRAPAAGGDLRQRPAARRVLARGFRAGSGAVVVSDDVNQLERFLDVGARTILHTFWTVDLRRRRVRRHVVAADPARLPAGADHRLGFDPLPAPPGAALQSGARSRRRGQRDRVDQPGRTHHHQGVHRRGSARSSASAGCRTPTGTPTGRAIRSSAAFVPLIRMAILAGFTSTLLLGGWFVLQGRLESACTRSWCS